MFNEVRSQLKETVQVEIDSMDLEPEIVDSKDGRFYLIYRSGGKVERYPCTQQAWESWAKQVLRPADKKSWSPTGIGNFLSVLDAKLANKVAKSWWENHTPKLWHVVKYKDSSELGKIRYIGSKDYRLYTNSDFLEDLSHAEFDDMSIRTKVISENYMLLRILDNKMLDLNGKKLFSGFHIVNSENGKASIVVKHVVYDLVCSNGLMNIVDLDEMVRQNHKWFDRKELRKSVVEFAKKLPEFHEGSKTLIRQLAELTFTQRDAGVILEDLKMKSKGDVSKKFIDDVGAKVGHVTTGWELISHITERAQSHSWGTRIKLEERAGMLARELPSWRRLDVVAN